MAQKTDAELTSEANVIGNETTEGANTADRVRDMLVNIIDSKGNNFTTYRKTAAQWTSDNTVLGDGVKGEETDTGKFKVGDGATAWNSLPYAGGATEPTTSTGTAIQFDKDRFYGESSAETGAFTLNSSGLVKGTTVVVRHNHATDNPFLTSDAEFIVVGGEYVVNEDNYIYMHAWSASVIHCNIVQHP